MSLVLEPFCRLFWSSGAFFPAPIFQWICWGPAPQILSSPPPPEPFWLKPFWLKAFLAPDAVPRRLSSTCSHGKTPWVLRPGRVGPGACVSAAFCVKVSFRHSAYIVLCLPALPLLPLPSDVCVAFALPRLGGMKLDCKIYHLTLFFGPEDGSAALWCHFDTQCVGSSDSV